MADRVPDAATLFGANEPPNIESATAERKGLAPSDGVTLMEADRKMEGGGHLFVHRQDIDGLRSVAVAGVVIFHMYPEWLPGGFTGVDIFFVISGFAFILMFFFIYSFDISKLSSPN